jgi:hypothetical protein
VKCFNGKPHHAPDKATTKFTALNLLVIRRVAVLREGFYGFFEDASVASSASEWLPVESTARANACAPVRLRLIDFSAADGQPMN